MQLRNRIGWVYITELQIFCTKSVNELEFDVLPYVTDGIFWKQIKEKNIIFKQVIFKKIN